MYEQTLTHAGLTPNQSAIYELLLKHGEDTAGNLAKVSPLKRTFTYKVLGELVELGLVAKTEKPRAVARFAPSHPLKLRDLAEMREQEAKDAQMALGGVLESLVSNYNMSVGKPGVQIFEGMEGIRRVAFDSLEANDEIYSYIDVEALEKYLKELNEEYMKERERRGKKKKIIVTYSPFNKRIFKKMTPNTDVRFIDYELPEFGVVMQMYNSRISYITMQPDRMIGVIIDNPFIAKMHRGLFEYTWSTATAHTAAEKPPTPPVPGQGSLPPENHPPTAS